MNWAKRITWALAITAVAVLVAQLDAGGFLLKRSEIPGAIQKLKTGTPKEKASAAEALGRRGAVRITDVKAAIAPLQIALKSEKDAKVRAAAAKALGMIGAQPKATVKLLLAALKNDKAEEVKVQALYGLGRIPTEARIAMPEITKLMRDKDKKNRRLRRAARDVMMQIRGK